MSEPPVLGLFAVLLLIWFAVSFALLSSKPGTVDSRFRWTISVLAGLTAISIVLFFETYANRWTNRLAEAPISESGYWGPESLSVFGLFSIGCLLSALGTVFSASAFRSQICFQFLLVCVAGLCLIHDAILAAILLLIFAGTLGGLTWWIWRRKQTFEDDSSSPALSHHPFLACLTGFIFSLFFVVAIAHSAIHESGEVAVRSSGRTILTTPFNRSQIRQRQNSSGKRDSEKHENNGVIALVLLAWGVTLFGGTRLLQQKTISPDEHDSRIKQERIIETTDISQITSEGENDDVEW
ncbi:MAG: hypothetical protein Tsb009_17270 [Planctomycetaceae bacterium]